MHFKHMLSFILALSLLFALTGCGGARPEGDAENGLPQAAVETALPEITAGDFLDGAVSRDEGYGATFKTKYVQMDDLTISFATSVFDEEASPALAQQLVQDCAALTPEDGLPGLSVYVVVATATGAPAVVDGQRVFCTLDCVESGDVRTYLTQACFGLTQYWQCVGLCAVLFGPGKEADLAELAAYYTDSAHTNQLSLFPAYFMDCYVDGGTRQISEQTAASLADYIVTQYGLETYLAEGCDVKYREEWLSSIGVSGLDLSVLSSPAAQEVAEMATAIIKNNTLTLESSQFFVQLPPIDWLTSADAVYDFLLYYFGSLEALFSRLETDAPEYYAKLSAGEIPQVTVRLYDYSIKHSSGYFEQHESNVGRYEDAVHETLHCLLPPANYDLESAWIAEGLVSYLELPYRPVGVEDPLYVNQSFYAALTGEMNDELSEADCALMDIIVDYYRALSGEDASGPVPFQNYKLLFEAMGYATLLNPELAKASTGLGPITRDIATHCNVPASYPGNQLTYMEAMLFLEYLIETHGLDAIIAAEMDAQAYRQIFPDAPDPLSFETQFNEFLAQLKSPLEEG